MNPKNRFAAKFLSRSENVGIARIAAAAFASQVDMTVSEIEEIKVAVSEAVTNAIVHGYKEKPGEVEMMMYLFEDRLEFVIRDFGKGIEDVALARKPASTTDPDRMGLGFAFMESFMDDLEVISQPGQGTTVRMTKKISFGQAH